MARSYRSVAKVDEYVLRNAFQYLPKGDKLTGECQKVDGSIGIDRDVPLYAPNKVVLPAHGEIRRVVGDQFGRAAGAGLVRDNVER